MSNVRIVSTRNRPSLDCHTHRVNELDAPMSLLNTCNVVVILIKTQTEWEAWHIAQDPDLPGGGLRRKIHIL